MANKKETVKKVRRSIVIKESTAKKIKAKAKEIDRTEHYVLSKAVEEAFK